MRTARYIFAIGAISAMNNESRTPSEYGSSSISTDHKVIKTAHQVPIGEIKQTNKELFADLSQSPYFDQSRAYTRTTLLALTAINEMTKDENALNYLKQGVSVAVFNGTTAGGIDRSEKYYYDNRNGAETNIDDIIGHDPADSTIQIAKFLERIGAKVSYYSTISTACSSSAVAIEEGIRMLDLGEIDCAICGGVDPLSKFTINGFKSLGIYSNEICKPFDAERDGLNLGEGAAFLLIRREKENSLGEVLSCSSASDAYHQTATSEEATGPTLAMNKALTEANISASEIAYINAHGTATPNNDQSEATAMKNVFGENIPPFSSTKCHTGHTLGASGAIEAALSVGFNSTNCLNITHPTHSFQNIDPAINLRPITEETAIPKSAKKSCIMSNSFGFGGGGSSLILNFGEEKGIETNLSDKAAYITFVSDDSEDVSKIPANLRRRMSRMTKGGVAVALASDIEFDALHVALGLGSISDTEKFLESVYSSNEELPNPTAFIQSTFNTLAGNITQIRHNHSPAITFVNRSMSFLNAIEEARWKIDENKNILVIASEEGTDLSNKALLQLGLRGIKDKAYSFLVSGKPLSNKSAKFSIKKFIDKDTIVFGKRNDLADYSDKYRCIAISEDLEGQMLHDAESMKLALDSMENNALIVGSYAGQGKHYIYLWR